MIHVWPLRAKPAAKVKMLEGDGKDDELERLLDSLARVASGSAAEDGGADAVAEPSPKKRGWLQLRTGRTPCLAPSLMRERRGWF